MICVAVKAGGMRIVQKHQQAAAAAAAAPEPPQKDDEEEEEEYVSRRYQNPHGHGKNTVKGGGPCDSLHNISGWLADQMSHTKGPQ